MKYSTIIIQTFSFAFTKSKRGVQFFLIHDFYIQDEPILWSRDLLQLVTCLLLILSNISIKQQHSTDVLPASSWIEGSFSINMYMHTNRYKRRFNLSVYSIIWCLESLLIRCQWCKIQSKQFEILSPPFFAFPQ